MKNLSSFGLRFLNYPLTQTLVESSEDFIIPMGIGNPAFIPEVNTLFKNRMKEILENDELFKSIFCRYSSNQGDPLFLEALAHFLNQTLGWNITKKNIAVTSGSQIGYFFLFNLLSGHSSQGTKKIFFQLFRNIVDMQISLEMKIFS